MTDDVELGPWDPSSQFLKALCAFQADLPTIAKDKKNPHFGSKYAGLDAIVAQVAPKLSEHGLVWITKPGRDDAGQLYLEYRLVHAETGVGETGRMPLTLPKNDMQGFGSALTYARRYALTAVLNLITEEDDDGNAAVAPSQARTPAPRVAPAVPAYGEQRPTPKPPPKPPPPGSPNDRQRRAIWALINEKFGPDPGPERRDRLQRLLDNPPWQIQLEEGWMDELTAGRDGTASALIDALDQYDPVPS